MLPDYRDIRDAALRTPDWHDGNGVPRYAPFTPDMLGVYAKFALLVEIECQSCSNPMLVGQGWHAYDIRLAPEERVEIVHHTLPTLTGDYTYGDPPWHEDHFGRACGAGLTMSSIPIRVIEAWSRQPGKEWVRDSGVENISLWPDWANDDYSAAP